MDSFYRNLSAKRRSALPEFIAELGVISAVQEKATPDFPLLLETVREYEQEWRNRLLNDPTSHRHRLFSEQPGYVADWTESFFATLDEWRFEAHDYRDAVSKYNNFRQSLPVLERDFFDNIQRLGLSVEEALVELHNRGYDAATLGAAEANFQLWRLAQLFFARYSAEVKSVAPSYQAGNSTPRPNLAAFMNKKSRRAALMRQSGASPEHWHIDDQTHLAFYIEQLNDNAPGDNRPILHSWQDKTRALYANGDLLLPGFPELDALLKQMKDRYGDFPTAYIRLSDEPANWRFYAAQDNNFRKFGGLHRTLADIAVQKDIVELRTRQALSVMGMAHGRTHASYYGRHQDWLLHGILRYADLPPVTDLYSQGEIDWKWQPLLAEWKREAAEAEQRKAAQQQIKAAAPKARRKPEPPAVPAALLPEPTEEQKLKATKRKEKKLRGADERKVHAEATALRAAAREALKREERQREAAAAKKAETTRELNKAERNKRSETRKKKQEEIRAAAEALSANTAPRPQPKAAMPQPKKKKARTLKPWQVAENETRLIVRKAVRAARRQRNGQAPKP